MKPDLKKLLEMPVNDGSVALDINGCGCIKSNYSYLVTGSHKSYMPVSRKISTILNIAEALLARHEFPQHAKIYAYEQLNKLPDSEFELREQSIDSTKNLFWILPESRPFSSGCYVPLVDKVKTRLPNKRIVNV